jgi:hypothetical protein
MIFLFLLFAIIAIVAWYGHRRAAIGLFIIFLIITALMLIHHMTDKLTIQL